MVLTPDPEAAEDALTALIGQNPWIVNFLEVKDEEDAQSGSQDPGTNTEETPDSPNDPLPDPPGNSGGKGKNK